MYVCMHVCMYVCMYVWMYVCMYVCIYVCMYVYAFDFINLPKTIRAREVCHNFLSDILMIGNNPNPQIKSILVNYKQYVVRLNIYEFFKNPHSIKS